MYESKKYMALDFQYKLIHDRLTAGLNSTQFTN